MLWAVANYEAKLGVRNSVEVAVHEASDDSSPLFLLVSGECCRATREAVATGLAHAGIQAVSIDTSDLHMTSELVSQTSVLVSMARRPEDEVHEQVLRALAVRPAFWLYTRLSEHGDIDIGPLFGPRMRPCYDCFTRAHSHKDAPASENDPGSGVDFQRYSNLVFRRIHELARVNITPGSRLFFHAFGAGQERGRAVPVVPLPDCQQCWPVPLSAQGINPIIYFEFAMQQSWAPQRRSRRSRIPGSQTPSSPSLLAVQENSGAIALAPPALPTNMAEKLGAAPPLDASTLGALLGFAAGIKGFVQAGLPKRWAPTAGNLGSVEPWIVLEKESSEEWYRYDAASHSLARVRGQNPDQTIASRLGNHIVFMSGRKPLAIILMAGRQELVAAKYGAFGYRLLRFDAGVALAHFAEVGQHFGLEFEVAISWPKNALEEQFSQELEGRCLTEMVGIFPASGIVSEALSIECFSHKSMSELIDDMSQYKSLRIADDREVRAARDLFCIPQGLSDILKHRKSRRLFSPRAMRIEDLKYILSARRTNPIESRIPLDYLVICRRVDGVESGVYRHVGGDSLERIANAPDPEVDRRCFVQPDVATGAATIVCLGDLTSLASCSAYDRLLVEAGTGIGALNLSAHSLRHDAVITAGLYQDSLASFVPSMNASYWPLLALTIGL